MSWVPVLGEGLCQCPSLPPPQSGPFMALGESSSAGLSPVSPAAAGHNTKKPNLYYETRGGWGPCGAPGHPIHQDLYPRTQPTVPPCFGNSLQHPQHNCPPPPSARDSDSLCWYLEDNRVPRMQNPCLPHHSWTGALRSFCQYRALRGSGLKVTGEGRGTIVPGRGSYSRDVGPG